MNQKHVVWNRNVTKIHLTVMYLNAKTFELEEI